MILRIPGLCAIFCLAGLAASLPAVSAAAASPAGAPPATALLPPGTEYDPAVPTPESVLGFAPGEWHARPDQILAYAQALAAASDRVTLEIQGTTHEGRPQPLLIITSPENHHRLEEIRAAHLALVDPSLPAPSPEELAAQPVVIWLGYSIHGNEASGANAAPAVAYYLAAGRGPEVEGLLDEAVVLIDPSLNPDGLGRFAQWANSHHGEEAVGDPDHREHREAWPGGRTNHYWFDLNRDWLLLQQPESVNRVATFRRWRPNLMGDYHEMGGDGTYFFQPGVAVRANPLIPAENQELTERVATYHAAALDALGRLYFTGETFDDFYPGKGSTYPDLNGSVGVLFEQASARGRRLDTRWGPLTLREAIADHVATSISMLRAARDLRALLLAYQARFYRDALAEARRDPLAAYVFAAPGDPVRAFRLRELLARHGVSVRPLAARLEAGGRTFEPGEAWEVPVEQPQYRLVKALFDRQTDFADTTFYDISTWTLPLAFGCEAAEVAREAKGDRKGARRGAGKSEPAPASQAEPGADLPGAVAGATTGGPDEASDGGPAFPAGTASEAVAPYAYLLPWEGTGAPRALCRLLAAGDRPAVVTRPFTAATDRGVRSFAPGTLLVPTAGAAGSAADLAARLAAVAAEDGVDVYSVGTGLSLEGVDLGSPKVVPLAKPKPLLVVGGEVSGYEAGEVWHLLDHRTGVPLPLVEVDRLARLDLSVYTHVLMVDGDYGGLGDEVAKSLAGWVKRGGVLVASRRAAEWAVEEVLAADEKKDKDEAEPDRRKGDGSEAPPATPGSAPPAPERPAYADFEAERNAERISGAIFEVDLDLTHPLAFGYRDPKLPVPRGSTSVLAASDNPYENVARYTASPLLSGYASQDNVAALAGTAAVVATRLGRGVVVRFADDLSFRAFWWGTQKLYLNAIFLAKAIQPTEIEEP